MMLKDRVAIVTGGAQGIGRAIVDKLSAEGAAVAVADINGTGAAEAAAAQPNAIGLTVDVSDPAAVDAMVASTVEPNADTGAPAVVGLTACRSIDTSNTGIAMRCSSTSRWNRRATNLLPLA